MRGGSGKSDAAACLGFTGALASANANRLEPECASDASPDASENSPDNGFEIYRQSLSQPHKAPSGDERQFLSSGPTYDGSASEPDVFVRRVEQIPIAEHIRHQRHIASTAGRCRERTAGKSDNENSAFPIH